METIWYVGDIHGDIEDLAKIDELATREGVKHIVQVGDLGIHWNPSDKLKRYFIKRARQGRDGPTWTTCGGNHENYDVWCRLRDEQQKPPEEDDGLVVLAPGCEWATRPTPLYICGVSHLFFGGARSIDKMYRVEGQSWWAYEQPTHAEWDEFFQLYDKLKPEVVVTHDCPLIVPLKYNNSSRESEPVPRMFDNVVRNSSHVPRLWAFGHHHLLGSWNIQGTKFVCCGQKVMWHAETTAV